MCSVNLSLICGFLLQPLLLNLSFEYFVNWLNCACWAFCNDSRGILHACVLLDQFIEVCWIPKFRPFLYRLERPYPGPHHTMPYFCRCVGPHQSNLSVACFSCFAWSHISIVSVIMSQQSSPLDATSRFLWEILCPLHLHQCILAGSGCSNALYPVGYGFCDQYNVLIGRWGFVREFFSNFP